MADPLRRTILAKLRGKKAKGKGSREGKEKVSHPQSERDCVSQEMRGERSGVDEDPMTGSGPRCTNLGLPVVGISDRYHRTEIRRFYTHGDSIGFGFCEFSSQSAALNPTDGQDVKEKETNVTLLEQKARKTTAGDFERSLIPAEAPRMFEYVAGNLTERHLIEILESSLEFNGDFRMQSPTFFPTELEIPTVAPGFREGAPRHHSVDSEEDDYYDNQTLPFYESSAQTLTNKRNTDTSASEKSTQETDRLKSQLKEAYHLLINTMHNIHLDVHGEDNGVVDPERASSRPDSSGSSQSSDKRTASNRCLLEERSAQQLLDLDLGGFTQCREALKRSKSSQNIPKANSRPILQRSVSDSKVKYSSVAQESPNQTNHESQTISGINPMEIPQTGPQILNDATLPKNPGVTVNKMQEWMEKGRVLSSEMKQRIMGTSARANHSTRMRIRPAPLETLASSSNTCPRDPSAHQHPFNHITVSKKRSWLQQCSTRGYLLAEDISTPPAGSEDPLHPPAEAHPLKNTRQLLSEENDADDEGEIWYNPIPEDEEVEGVYANRMMPTVQADARGGVLEGRRESLGSDGTVVVCRAPEENLTVRVTDSLEQPTGGLSPPSSPNPVKRSTAINWSFPEKIKSPRTVRKLSMKMKKLPELSRKLSVKGNGPVSNGQSEHRAHSPKANGIAELVQSQSRLALGGVTTALASGNVIWRYHLDSSVSTQHNFDKRRSNSGGIPKSASKGGYLSDGDSPELVAKSGKHGNSQRKGGKSRDRDPSGNGGSPKLPGTELDIDAFRSYSFTEQPKCLTYISGLMSLHFYGAEDLKPPRADSRDIYCAIQVDSVNKARTALLTCRTAFLDMDHTFNIDLENAQHLKLVVFSWESTPRRNRVCCHGTVVLPALFRVSKTHQLAVRLEPRGMIYVKLSLMEQRQNSLDGADGDHEKQVFGVEARQLVEREASGLMVPLLIEKCISEIEKRGCQIVGLYRLCGSAAVKKELREAFERNSHSVELSENNYPDINVITGVLKDYLRELPRPLITKSLYESVLEAMAKRPLLMGSKGCENETADSEHTVSLLEILPEIEKVTLRKLLDHLKRVASHQEQNKMSCQNLAVCFGPVLLSQRQEASCVGKRVFLDSEELASALHFKKHIEVLHYLLQLWPVVGPEGKSPSQLPESVPEVTSAVRRRKERPQVLNLTQTDISGVLRPRAGRLDSPSNRYAGDWSACQETYLQPCFPEEADYDDVPSEDLPSTEQEDLPNDIQDVVSKEEFPGVNETIERVEQLHVEVEEEEEEEEEASEEEDTPELDRLYVEEPLSIDSCDDILPQYMERQPKEHTYQAYMKIQEISPVLSNRVNLRDLQESIDTLIGNLERELNKNKLNLGY